jgi:hypothetical protein
MRCRSMAAVPFLALFLALPATAQKNKPQNKPQPQAPLDADKLASGKFTGFLLTTPGTDRTFTVRVQYQNVELKPNALRTAANANNQANRQLQQVVRLQQQMARSRNPAQQMMQIQRIVAQLQLRQARAQQNLYNVVTHYQDVEFQAEEAVKVRTLELPDQFDEKGNIKRYTREELRQLKGKDTHLPGYESAFESLKEGQLVQLTLANHQTKKPAGGPGDTKDKAKLTLGEAVEKSGASLDKALDKDGEKHKQVRLIVIVKENPGAIPGGRPGKRGK